MGLIFGVNLNFLQILRNLNSDYYYNITTFRLVAVNNIQVRGLTHEQILTVLRSAGDTVKLEVEYSLDHPVFFKPKNTMSKCTEIILEKETGGFGFTIRGGSYGPDTEKCRPITVTAIRPGGPAHRFEF